MLSLAVQVSAWIMDAWWSHVDSFLFTGALLGSASAIINLPLMTAIGVYELRPPSRLDWLSSFIRASRALIVITLCVIAPLLMIHRSRHAESRAALFVLYAPTVIFLFWRVAVERQQLRAHK